MKTYKRYSIIIISFLAIIFINKSSNGCADYDADDDFFSIFAPETANEPTYRPFFFSYYPSYDWFEEDTVNTYENYNIKEWQKFFNNQLSAKKLKSIIYNSTDKKINADLQIVNTGKVPPNLQPLNLSSPIKKFLEYMAISKTCEKWANIYEENDDWDLKVKTVNKFEANKLVANLKTKYNNETNTFIKQRYAYQTVRMLFYTLQFKECMQFFTNAKELTTQKDYLYYMSLRYVGGAMYRTKNYAEANFIFAKLFDEFPLAKEEAHNYFHPQEESDWQETLQLATTNNEKIAVWALFGFYADPLRAVENMYAIDSKSKYIPIITTRLINIAEMYHFNKNSYPIKGDYEKKQNISTKTQLQNSVNFLQKCVAENKNANQAFFQTALSYMQFFTGNYQQALNTINTIDISKIKNNETLKEQIVINKLMSEIANTNTIDANFEQKIYQDYKWLTNKIENSIYARTIYYYEDYNKKNYTRKSDAYEYCREILAQKYKNQNDFIKAELSNLSFSYTKNNTDLQKIIDYIDAKHTPFEQLLIANYPLSKKDLVEQQAVQLAYNNDLKAAIQIFEKYPNAGNDTLFGNPFNAKVNDCHECDHVAKQKTRYTKLTFLKKMLLMDSIAKANPNEAANNYYLMANGYYNMSYFGNARRFYETKLNYYTNSLYAYYDEKEIQEAIQEPFHTSKLAASYYQKAMNLSTDKNQQAKCCWMLAKCEMNDYYNSDAFFKNKKLEDDKQIDFVSGRYYKKLKTEFANTQYYQEVIAQCGYFNTYLSK